MKAKETTKRKIKSIPECYFLSCKKRATYKMGRATAHFCLCKEHYNFAWFIRDITSEFQFD